MARTSVGGMGTLKKGRGGFPPFYKDESFWRGFAGVYGLFGAGDRLARTEDPWEADYRALRGDWMAVGFDMRRAMRRFEEEHAEELAGQRRLFDPDEVR